MDQSQLLEKAKQFAQTAYAAASNEILRKNQYKLGQMRAEMARRGMIQSGAIVSETARIVGEQIKELVEARLNVTLEGYELHGIPIDDTLAATITTEIVASMNHMVAGAKNHSFRSQGVPPSAAAAYLPMIGHHVDLTPAWIKTQIDRRRLMHKKSEGLAITTIYNVQGENARVNVNSNDNSVNLITKSKDEFFATLQQRIASAVPGEDEKQQILTALAALQEAHGKPSFSQRYIDFIGTAANHVVLLTPFIPALTEMLRHSLS